MKQSLLIAILSVGLLFAQGCVRSRTVFVPETEPVMLAEDVKAYIFYEKDGKLLKSSNRVRLSAGLWIMSMPEDKDGN